MTSNPMSKTHRKEPSESKPKPRQIKRQKQREAMMPPLVEFPTREPVMVYGRMG